MSVSFVVEGEYQKISLFDSIALVIDGTVVEEVALFVVVPMTVDTELQRGKMFGIASEYLGHSSVGNIRQRVGVHDKDTLLGFGWKVGKFVIEKLKIGNGHGVVKVERIHVEAHNPSVARGKCKIVAAENFLKNQIPVSQAVVVAQQTDVGAGEAVEYVALEFKLFSHSKVGHVAGVDNEIDVVPPVYCLDSILGFVVPALCVADDGKPYLVSSAASLFDALNISGIHPCLAGDAHIVGVIFDAAWQKQECCNEQINSIHVNYLFYEKELTNVVPREESFVMIG